MGAPKQKWTAEEEAALKAGVAKHGIGKWRTILMDPEFSAVLRLRSNVDLKDKWRNINVTAIWGSRQKAKLALKRNPQNSKRGDTSKILDVVQQSNDEDAKSLTISNGTPRNGASKVLNARLENVILEAITTLKEPSGSDRASIALYIEDKYKAPPNLKKLLTGKLKLLTANGKLIKVKHKYRFSPSSTGSESIRSSPLLLLEGKQKDSSKPEKSSAEILNKSQVNQELSKIRGMTALEAAAAAAKAVAEAEAAIAAAEEAAREAEKAEAEAEAAQVFAKAAMKAFRSRTCHA
ncbi:hypothetical protein K2173_014775 [Erythroxylum novogranatense]|uniref:MYB transcription factor n=1 Tax=Erythroxylum novogranatense TaxID=1862640 RepID=A0AAV8THA6_9ROSI|nr:hypothetical protein K2173_014775 [Erythroxylum novogranatense]